MGSILSLVVPALIPALADGLRGVFSRLTGGAGAKPQTVEEQIKLMAAENERLKALAELDKPAENISPWVADLRASFRYIAAGVIIFGAISTLYAPKVDAALFEAIWNLAGSVFSFMFGDRMYIKFVKK
ncbi:MAG: hypothetical protein HY914_23435 [Desulfomonile tiedjei]|nr:hypothetical protein [Desulfomonile tiedjei]